MTVIDSDLLVVQEARVLSESARRSAKELGLFSQEKLDSFLSIAINTIKPCLKELAFAEYEETDFGRAEDKHIKLDLLINALEKSLSGLKCVGFIGADEAKKTADIGVPIGPVLALIPSTNAVATVLHSIFIAIKSANPIVLIAEKEALNTAKRACEIVKTSLEMNGYPGGAISILSDVSDLARRELLKSEYIALVIGSGNEKLRAELKKSEKPYLYSGYGSGPAFIERTADIEKATKDIITSKSFDYGIVTSAESLVIVDKPVENEVRDAFIRNGAYFMTEDESANLGQIFYNRFGELNPQTIGVSAQGLAKMAGFSISDSVRVLISEKKYALETDPYSREKLCPVLAYFIEDDWMNACEKCIELILEENKTHSLVIHSKDEFVITQFALKKPVARVFVNTPTAFGGMGITTGFEPSAMLGDEKIGISSKNVTPLDLVYIRKLSYELSPIENILSQYN
jgi:acyl-CoA reductase-like NAD-dependent aldehyde dehydrogenase